MFSFCSLSCTHRRPHPQDEMIEHDAFVKLAQCCARACLVLKAATEGGGAGDLSEPVQKAIESLERYVNFTHPLLPSSITNNARTLHRIKSQVTEYVSGANFDPEHRPGSTEASPVLWKTEFQKILESIEVCGHPFGLQWFLNYLSGVCRQRVLLCLAKMNSAHSRPPTCHLLP